ncbi:MAG: hypothetical protein WDZ54_12805 [Sneathiella sp.]
MMEITRPIANIVPLPSKRDDADAYLFGRKSTASRRDSAPIESGQDLAAKRQQSQPNTETAKNPSNAPIQLRDIQPTFLSSREIKDAAHSPYSAQFLAQQLGQQEADMVSVSPMHAHGRAAAAYDSSLSLTATVIGFEGRAERLA